ncbi:uncharacterized protein VP01_79g6 [Puccinia sorghi]|uniref:Uncharacterized protein n=1 Tax=Puccinia sorghi TaxID=27349 RepID=A0A0L6UAQ0_9BASI|nr:uncharacterized protein VP01_79g6 [Puccinia sorghi]
MTLQLSNLSPRNSMLTIFLHGAIVTNFIRMHLSHNNLEQFVPNISKYKPKLLWDSIVTHFAEKTVENSANALDCLFDTQFIEGNMDKCVKNFQASFRQLTEVSSNFNKKSLKKASSHFHRVSTTPVCKLQRLSEWPTQYFRNLSSTSSSVFGANGDPIPILGFAATIPTAFGPLHLSLAYFTPSLLNSLISLTHFLRLGFSILPAKNGRRFRKVVSDIGGEFINHCSVNLPVLEEIWNKKTCVGNLESAGGELEGGFCFGGSSGHQRRVGRTRVVLEDAEGGKTGRQSAEGVWRLRSEGPEERGGCRGS